MKKNVSRLLTAVVSAAMLTGMMPSVICADDIDGAADSVAADVVSSGEDTAAAAQEVTASVSLTDLITGLPSVRTAADDSTVTGQSGAFDGNLTIAFDAADILSPLAGLLSDSGADGVTIGNPDGASENAVTAVLHFPDYVTLGAASATDDLASVRADVKTDDSTKTATVSFVVKDSDAASFLSHYEADQTDLGSGAEGTTKTADDGAGTVRADVITIPMSGDVGSGTSFASLEGAVSAATPDTGITLTAGAGTVTYSFSGSSAPVSAGEAEEEQPSSDGTSLTEPEETSSAAENEPAPDSQVSPAVSEPEGAFSGSDSTDVSRDEENQLLPSDADSSGAQAATYGVRYEFVSGTEGRELPESVTELLPSDDGSYTSGTEVTAQAPEKTSVETEEGSWIFESYDFTSATVADGDVTFTGTWQFIPKAESTASSVLTESTVSSAEPETGSTVSSAASEIGDTASSAAPASESASSASSSAASNQLLPSDTDSSEAQAATYGVRYEFVSGTEGKELPESVTALLPADDGQYTSGTEVTAQAPEKQSVETEDGTWTFRSYDADQKLMADGDMVFTGTWVFAPKASGTETTSGNASSETASSETASSETASSDTASSGTDSSKSGSSSPEADTVSELYSVFYDFSAQDGTELPVDVMDQLPKDGTKYKAGTKVTAQAPARTTVEEPEGTWTFAGYDHSSLTVTADGDNTFYGIWTFKSAETYEVKYQFVSDNDQYRLPDAVMELIPGDGNEYTAGSTVTARKPAASKVSVSDGTWNFRGYDQDSAVVEDSDITFTGTWSFEKKEVKTYNVHYTFVSGTEGFGIPDDVAALLPSDGNEYESGQEVRAISPAETTLTVGSWIWTFAGYDQSKKTVGDSDITFTGTWTCRKNIDPNEKVTLKIVKKWVDSGNAAKARPSSISVTLYKNGTKYETFTCKAPTKTADTWTYTLPALPKYEDEKEISWTVDEAAVQGYSKSIDGMVITNTYGTKVNAAKTGDTSPIGLYVGVAVAALAVVVILLIAGRRKKK
ncbi:MAG: SHIRT domain-containing protein [Clostridiales bacterium]|nr:SHIRT domain-containing protein [Clostridiales bacterium]